MVTQMAATTALPQWNDNVAREVADEILDMTHVRTDKQRNELLNRTLKVTAA